METRKDSAFYCQLLLHEDRLRVLGALAVQPGTVQQTAERLAMEMTVAARSVGKLVEAGLVRHDPSGLYTLDVAAVQAARRSLFTQAPPVVAATSEEKVLRNFLDGDRLSTIPASASKRLVVLRWLAEKFEPGATYPERTVNDILRQHHDDYAALRRYLVDAGLLQRDQGVYWRPAEEPFRGEGVDK